jgi:hypothetical protein
LYLETNDPVKRSELFGNLSQLEFGMSEELKPIHNAFVNCLANGYGHLYTRDVGEGDTCIIYYVFEDSKGVEKALPLFAKRKTVPNKSYSLENTFSKFKVKPVPISSNGQKFVELDKISGKTNIYDRVVIFKGFSQENEDKMSDDAKAFNKRNRGKAFILISNKVDNHSVSQWPSYLNVKYNTENQIDYFIDENGNRYMSLIGVQRTCSPDTFRELLFQIATARYADTREAHDVAIQRIESLIGQKNVFVR